MAGGQLRTGKLIVVGGGARSGKSWFALALARERAQRREGGVYIATAEPLDDEMAERIRAHRVERGGWLDTVEEPLALPEALGRALAGGAGVVVVDCLTLWVSNLLGRGEPVDPAFDRLEAVLGQRGAGAGGGGGGRTDIVLVTNEVGMGLVPETPLGRAFRDATGRLHQRLARRADEVYVAVMGMVVRLRPGPVEAFPAAASEENPRRESGRPPARVQSGARARRSRARARRPDRGGRA
jgi:adenosylcobinamide kinase/adenosylcobinamide-phosphate guanylyltransferase